jgi:hypothetical protein
MKSTTKGVVIVNRIPYLRLLFGLVALSVFGSVQAIALYYTFEGECCVSESQISHDIAGLQSVDPMSFIFLVDNDVGMYNIEQDSIGGGVDDNIPIDDEEEDRVNTLNSRLILASISDTLPSVSDSEPPASLLLGIGLLGIAWRQRVIVVRSRVKKRF